MAARVPEVDLILEFAHPLFLLLAPAALWVWYIAGTYSAAPHRAMVARRIAIVLLMTLSLSGVRLRMGDGSMAVTFVVDRSESMPRRAVRTALATANQLTDGARRTDFVGLITFAADAAVDGRPAQPAHLTVASSLSTGASNIARALKLARLTMPRADNRRIVLISDGRETAGDSLREAAFAAADGLRIDVLMPPGLDHSGPAGRVVHVSAPRLVREAEPFDVTVLATGTAGTRSTITLVRDDGTSVLQDVVYSTDGTATTVFSDSQRDPGLYTYRAFPEGSDADDNAGTVVTVSGQARVLYASTLNAPVAKVLDLAAYDVVRISPESLPQSERGLQSYDAVVLDDVPPEALTEAQTSVLERYVRDNGGGLLVLGRAGSLAPSSFVDGALARMLPVDLRPRTGKRAPAAALVLVFDKSGSMANLADGVAKMELARQSVLKVIDVLPANQPFGVIAFDTSPTAVLPLARARDRALVRARLDALVPTGGTALTPALEAAGSWLTSAETTRRHVLLISDGRTSPEDAARLRAVVKNGGFTLSVVAIGADANQQFLEQLAQSTGGRAYFPAQVGRLPSIAAGAAAETTGGSINDETFTLRALSHPVVRGLADTTLPHLKGYVVAAVKPGAETILSSHLDDPILAAWRFGLGKVAVFTGDLYARTSGELRGWSGFGALWAQCVRWLSRQTESREIHATLRDVRGAPQLSVEAERPDGTPANALTVSAIVRPPNGGPRLLELAPVAPGRFEAPIEATARGTYAIDVTARDPQTASELRVLRGFYWTPRDERASGVDLAALQAIVRAGNGRILSPNENPFLDSRTPRHRDLSAWMALGALLLFVVDVLIRRGAIRR